MATKAGEIELDVRLTGDDISKTLHKISDSITKKFDSAFSSLSKDFENVRTDLKQSFSKVAEGVSQKTEKEFSNIKGSGEQLSNSVSSSFKKIGAAVVAAFSVAKIKEFGQSRSSVSSALNRLRKSMRQIHSLSRLSAQCSRRQNQPFRALPIKAVFLKPDYKVSAQAFMPLRKLRVWTVQVLWV
jgi:hypothetical protein